ncbi:MAG: serine/threonine protein kinase, partial [Gammaproteobacteria bacterium]|nr:serine/threonine protein kinase [Gammaproteobacteria bacterium]
MSTKSELPDAGEIPFAGLTPDFILQSIDDLGFLSSGQLLALNSYENRVYQIGIEDESPIIAKFYRPGRWSAEAIREEHEFSLCLAENDIPVVPPLLVNDETLHSAGEYLFAVYERKPGRAPDITIDADLQQLGRLLARIHLVGKSFPFEFREKLSVKLRGYDAREFVLSQNFLPDYLRDSYDSLTQQLLALVESQFEAYDYLAFQS